MKKFVIQIGALVIVILLAFYLTFNPSSQQSVLSYITGAKISSAVPQPTPTNQKRIKIGENIINIEIADTPTTRQKGLSGRDSLDANSGMLFVFDAPDKYQFWMKDMKMPLDFIFINNNKVVDFIKNVPVPSDPTKLTIYQPTQPVNMVLEVNSGYVDKHNIQLGQTVYLVQ